MYFNCLHIEIKGVRTENPDIIPQKRVITYLLGAKICAVSDETKENNWLGRREMKI